MHSSQGSAIDDDRRTIDFLGIKVDTVDATRLLQRVITLAERDRSASVMYVNADCMLIARHNVRYRQALNEADLVYADGFGVVLGARLWGHRLPGRLTAADFMPVFCREFARRGLRVFLLGGRPGVARDAGMALLEAAPGLVICGTRDGYFGPDEMASVEAEIDRSRPDILLVGLGAPNQELWMIEEQDRLAVPVVWGVGGLFDFISGRTWRGPSWLTEHGFEWLCRLIAEPRRLWRRYIIGIVRFLSYVIVRRARDGF